MLESKMLDYNLLHCLPVFGCSSPLGQEEPKIGTLWLLGEAVFIAPPPYGHQAEPKRSPRGAKEEPKRTDDVRLWLPYYY